MLQVCKIKIKLNNKATTFDFKKNYKLILKTAKVF